MYSDRKSTSFTVPSASRATIANSYISPPPGDSGRALRLPSGLDSDTPGEVTTRAPDSSVSSNRSNRRETLKPQGRRAEYPAGTGATRKSANLLRNLRFQSKLVLVLLVPLCALAAFSALGVRARLA